MKATRIGFLLSVIFTMSFAGGPGEGEITVRNIGAISSLQVRYNISQLMGEPTVNAVYRWESNTVTELDPDEVLWILVENEYGQAYIKADPTVPGRGKWGYNTAGSPDWDEVLVKTWNGKEVQEYHSAEKAKAFWKAGFTVVNVKLSKVYYR